MRVYAAYGKDEIIRSYSSSGGIFSTIANYVIDNNGIVFGVKFNDKFEVEYSTAETYEELACLRKSKYVQSKLSRTIIDKIEAELSTNRLVLFCGTPCHANAVIKNFKDDYDNLYILDFVCHGTPQQRVWLEYIKYLEHTYNSIIDEVDFRDKQDSWKSYSITIKFDNEEIYRKPYEKDIYMKAFLSDLVLSGGCYCCKCKGVDRNTDLTLGDFWGIQNICPKMDDDKGTSIVLVHSSKGEQLINSIKNNLIITEIDNDEYKVFNPSIINSPRKPELYNYFFEKLGKRRFDKLVNDCLYPKYYSRLIRKVLKFK